DMLERQARNQGQRMPPRSAIEEQVLERLILTRLEVLRAEGTGIRAADADVDQALEQVARQNQLSLAQLRQAIEGDGVDFREFRRDIREEILTSRLRQRVVNGMEEITDTEIDIMLASDRFGGEQYRLSQILISVPESAGPAELAQARDRADDARQQLLDGLDFETAALTFSQAPDALDGGDLGWRNLNAVPPMIAEVLDGAEPGFISEPIRTPGGFVILRVADVRERGEVIVPEYQARHMMVAPSELMPEEDARQLIFELHERIENGEDFAELAREYSDDETTANIGGLFDWFAAGTYGGQFQALIDSMEVGDLSEPFQSPVGWHIIRLEDQRQADRTTETLRAEARDMLYRQKAEEEVERFQRQLRDESFVEIRL
ncbi:MAG: peptidylprolyl isomerase, partial [Wenzhouxiangella sp.]|nr:peptidylprolyl isomerase [Wenzhouxiangella sp.]